MPEPLPCAETRSHGKPDLCRVPEETAHSKSSTHGNNFICRVSAQKTHSKAQHTANMCVCRVLKKDAHGKPLAHGKEPLFAVCLLYCTRQTFGTRQNYAKKVDTTLPIFSSMHIQCIVLLVKICYIFSYFSYI